VHLVNHTLPFQPTAADLYLPDSIPVLADVSFEVRLPHPARSIEPLPRDEVKARWKRHGDVYRVTLPRLHYHAAVRFAGAAAGEGFRP
jgi:hypothetical protein